MRANWSPRLLQARSVVEWVELTVIMLLLALVAFTAMHQGEGGGQQTLELLAVQEPRIEDAFDVPAGYAADVAENILN